MTAGFKDHFSGHADSYAAFRPHYPSSLFDYLAGLCSEHVQAWDCGTGNGQAARQLARVFKHVIATDASEQQIANAAPCERVTFRLATAESSGLEKDSTDLVTVAQALHWFDIEAFFDEVRRVLNPGGILAVWSYARCFIDGHSNETVEKVFAEVEEFWPAEREIVEGRYQNIKLPFDEIAPPQFDMRTSWSADQMLGYMRTWSAAQRYLREKGIDPTEIFAVELKDRWGRDQREVCWPITLKLGKK